MGLIDALLTIAVRKREDRAAARALIDEVGLLSALRLGRAIEQRARGGAPFDALPPPDSEDEALSRAQIGPALLLYEELQKTMDADSAYEITERVAVAGAVAFLTSEIGPLRRRDLESLDAEGRERFVKERGRRFFNATVRWDAIEPQEVRFTVTACRFPRLCAAAGYPELAPIFCKGDETFFGTVEPDVGLDRPHTIAEGAATCPFRISFRDEPS